MQRREPPARRVFREDGSHSRLGRILVRATFGSICPGFPVTKERNRSLREVFERTAVIRDSAESMCERNFGSIYPGFPVSKEGDHPRGEVFERTAVIRDSAESMCGRILAAFTRVSPKAKEGTTRFAKFFRGNGVFRDCDQILLCTKPGPLERRTLEGFRGTVVIRDSTESQVRDTDKPARPSGAPDPSWVLRNGSHSATRPNLWCTTINRPPLGARTLEGFRETAVIRDSAESLCTTGEKPAALLGAGPLEGFRETVVIRDSTESL